MNVRLAAVQYLFRSIDDWDGFENQIRFTLGVAAEYKPHFVMLPEIVTSQLLSFLDTDKKIGEAVRRMDQYTPRYLALMQELATRYGFYLIGGSHPNLRDGKLYNTAFLFTPQGRWYQQDKIHMTRWEKEKWDTSPGDKLHLFETEYGAIAILICYDIEFPELARQVCEAGADILFVPSSTDDRQGFCRVRYCAQARAIENQVYVAMTSTVGNLPVEGLGMHYGQASILTPSDFSFARDGIAAEGVPNMEQVVIADVELAKLEHSRINGTTIPLYDKRREVYQQAVARVKCAFTQP